MKRPIIIILSVFCLTILAGLIYAFYLSKTIHESATIAIPFAFIAVTGWALFAECIIFALIFYRQLSIIWTILLPVFLITAIVPSYFVYKWCINRPAKVPIAGQLPVSVEQYQADSKFVVNDYLKTEIDSNNVDIYQDTIQTAQIDTIFYSLDNSKFFAIIIASVKDGYKQKYCAKYRVGRRKENSWKLNTPKGNIWTTCFSSINIFKKSLRQYYYKRYSINNSSDRPEIWSDQYIFNF